MTTHEEIIIAPPSVIELKKIESGLEASISQKKKELKEIKDSKTSLDTLKASLKEYQEESTELAKTISCQKGVIGLGIKQIKEQKETLEFLEKETEDKRIKKEQEITKLDKETENEKTELKNDLVGFVLSLAKEKEDTILDFENKTALAEDNYQISTTKLNDTNSYLLEKTKEKKVLELEIKTLGENKSSLEKEVKILQGLKDEFEFTQFDITELRDKIAKAKEELEKITNESVDYKKKLEIREEDLGVKDEWIKTKEKRIANIVSTLAKKTEDPSILRMLNDF